MRHLFILGLVFILAGCATLSKSVSKANSQDPIVIMVGIDGLRWDAIDRHPASTLHALATQGVRAERMLPVMPTMTFVNFYSLATGLYADTTGITSNFAYSRKFGEVMDPSKHTQSRWWGGEPIWVTAGKQDIKTATMFWLGSETKINGGQPTHWLPFDKHKPHEERVDQVLEWLALPEKKRPRLLTLYFSDVDTAGHRYGPETEEEGSAIAKVDASLADLRAGIETLGLTERVNIIVVSDHGMTRVNENNVVYLDDYIDFDDVFMPHFEKAKRASKSPFVHLFVKNGDVDGVFAKLDGAHPNLQVFKRDDIPENWHLNNSDRTGDIFAVVDPSWLLYGRTLTSRPREHPNQIGMHGYDRFHKDMGASFIAAGPNFKSGITAKQFNNVEVYGIIANILGIDPAQTDGNIENVAYFLNP